MKDNKKFIFNSLKLLESNHKIKEIHWLTESYFCEVKFGISWEDEVGAKVPVLKILYPNIDKKIETKSKNEKKDLYYQEEIILNGIQYLVYNNWLPNVRTAFLEWIKEVLGSNVPEIKEIEDIIN